MTPRESFVARIRREQSEHMKRTLDGLTYGDISGRLSAYLLTKALQRPPQEKDPMNIRLYIREIANGVVITIDAGPGDTSEFHYPDPKSAFSAAPDLLQQAWADAAESRHPLNLEEAFKRHYPDASRYRTARNEAQSTSMPEVFGEKLPEEAAAEAVPEPEFIHEQAPVRFDPDAHAASLGEKYEPLD